MHTHTPRIAIDCRLMHYRKAGIAQYTRRLVQALTQLPISPAPTLLVLLDRRDVDTAWLPAGVRAIRTVTPAHHRYEPVTLPLELALRRIDLLHSPDFVTARGRFRKVVTVHDLYFMEHPEVMSPDGARYYARVPWSARAADHIIAVSDFTRRDILRLLPGIPASKIEVVYEAADKLQTDDAGRMIDNHHSTIVNRQSSIVNPYALFVGTFEPRKNLATLLRACAGQADNFRLVVVGESGWGKGEPACIARELGLADRVRFAGRASDAELDALYRGARLLAFPSLSEGFGLPVLEAMARGVPVVCSNAGALPEVAGDAALLHDPLDVAGLAQAMRRLWSDEALHADYAQRGRLRAGEFSWQRAAAETWGVYTCAF